MVQQHIGYFDVSTVLLEHCANVNEKGEDSATPLFEASQEDHADVCTVLLEHNVNINENTKNSVTLLFQVAQNDHVDVCTVT